MNNSSKPNQRKSSLSSSPSTSKILSSPLSSPQSPSSKQLQLPLKTIFLNKYEQLKNPNPSSPSELSSNTGFHHNNKTVIVDNTNSTVLGGLILDPSINSQQHQLQSSHLTGHQISPGSNFGLINSMSNQYTREQQQSRETISKASSSGMASGGGKKSIPSTSGKSTPVPSTSGMKRHLSGSNSSLQNSDEDDDFGDDIASMNQYLDPSGYSSSRSKEEKRRLSHTAAEQKRRNAIKQGYELLQNVVPSCQPTDPIISTRITRATTLEQTIDYIHELQKEKDRHDQELDSLKKEITALKIMRQNYEEMLQYHRNQPKNNPVEVNEEAKFDLFVKFSDNLFQSFQSMINPNTFGDLSGSLFNWLEQAFSANNIKNIVYLSLVQGAQQLFR